MTVGSFPQGVGHSQGDRQTLWIKSAGHAQAILLPSIWDQSGPNVRWTASVRCQPSGHVAGAGDPQDHPGRPSSKLLDAGKGD